MSESRRCENCGEIVEEVGIWWERDRWCEYCWYEPIDETR